MMSNNNSASTPWQLLPDEIIFYILSFLPLSSLLRCRSVCKLWNTLYLHPHFTFLYIGHGGLLDDLCQDKLTVFFDEISQSSEGFLSLRKTCDAKFPYTYCIWCPTLLRILAIPDPQYPSICNIALEFVPSNQAVKLVSVYQDEYSLGHEILTLGIGSGRNSYRWRTIQKKQRSKQDAGMKKRIEVFFRKEVAYCIWYVDDDIEVDVLDMVNESYIGHTSFPRGKLSSTNLMDWNGQLSFAQLVKDELHILVLDDNRKLKWAETKRIIKLTFLKPDNKELFRFFTYVDKSLLIFVGQDKRSMYQYNIYTGNLSITNSLWCFESSCVAVKAAHIMLNSEWKRVNDGCSFRCSF